MTTTREAFYAGYHARSMDLRWNVPLQSLEHDALESLELWKQHDDPWARETATAHEQRNGKPTLGHRNHASQR